MEQSPGRTQQAAWRACFRRIYLSRLVSMLHHGKFKRVTSVSTRSRTVKFAADLSLAMTSSGRTAWSRAIICKYLFRTNNSRCGHQVVNSRRNCQAKQRSVFAVPKPCKPNSSCNNSRRQLAGAETGLTVSTDLRSRDSCAEEAGGTVGSRMQILRTLVPGSLGLDTPDFLKEAADYIVALNMQVQTMQALADCYSNSKADASRHVSI